MTAAPIVIPAFEPDGRLEKLLDALDREAGAARPPVLLVDDGSRGEAARRLLAALATRAGVTVLRHDANRGKGVALRTGIAAAAARGAPYVVTADADGQHAPADILRLHEAMRTVDLVHVGSRRFDSDVPLRSRIGNIATRVLFNLFSRNRVEDTQSGLRAIPARWFEPLLSIAIDGYGFEFEALLRISDREPIVSMPIDTIYEPGNPTSHFRPVVDSMRVYFVLMRYIAAVPAIAVAEFAVFYFLSQRMEPVSAFWIARGLSLGVYFFAMRNAVFRSQGSLAGQVARFGALVAVNIAVTTAFIEGATRTLGNPVPGYVASIAIMLVVNFLIQRHLIFRREP